MTIGSEETIVPPKIPTVRFQEKTLTELGIPDGGEFIVESIVNDMDSFPERPTGTDAVLRISPPDERGEGGLSSLFLFPDIV